MSSIDGNTREIIRRLRDAFLDEGWSRFGDTDGSGDPAAREAVEQVLIFLAGADVVTPLDVQRMGKLLGATHMATDQVTKPKPKPPIIYLLWPPTIDPAVDAKLTATCYALKAKYGKYLECARHINEVVSAIAELVPTPMYARQYAWRRMVEVCKLNTP